jgi:nicotinate (nicotinamide) nucleotide adenylyltransferase
MAFEFVHRGAGKAGWVAVFPGAYNPPTIAHVAIARAALAEVEEVIWVLPRAFPHKGFEGAGFDDRCRMLKLLAERENRFSVAVSGAGLYAEIADEARDVLGEATRITLVLGRDAAERIAAWDYGVAGFFDDMLKRYPLLVAARAGDYQPPEGHGNRILRLPLAASFDEVSSSEVRRLIAEGGAWRALIPAEIADLVQSLYVIAV